MERGVLAAVRVGAVERWIKVVFSRSERNARRGASLKLHLANVSACLVEHSHWVKRRGFYANSLGRLVDSGIKFTDKVQTTKVVLGTGSAAGAAAKRVERLVQLQAGC